MPLATDPISSSKSREVAKGFIKGYARNILFEISNHMPDTEFWCPRDLKGVDTEGALGAEAPPDFQLYIIFYWEQLLFCIKYWLLSV